MKYKTISLEDKEIKYFETGHGNKKPVIFIHGWGVTPIVYEESLLEIGKKYHVYAPYLRNTGDMNTSLMYLKAFCDNLDIHKPVVMGHSAAGISAVSFAHRFPDVVSALILIDSMGIKQDHVYNKGQWLFRWSLHVLHLLKPTKKRGTAFFFKLLKDFLGEILHYPWRLTKDVNYAIDMDIVPLLKKLSIPVLILWGKNDDLTPLYNSYVMVQAHTTAELAVIPGGHDWIKTYPELLMQKVELFIDKLK